jgi:hypothetical protein
MVALKDSNTKCIIKFHSAMMTSVLVVIMKGGEVREARSYLAGNRIIAKPV